MRKPTLTAIALTALLMVAFQNCGKLGFSLASNDKSLGSLVGLDAGPRLSVTGDVPVAPGADATLTVLTKNANVVTYACADDGDGTIVAQGNLDLFDGVGVLKVTVHASLTCTFVATATDDRTVETSFNVPTS